jgi:hypothetical protein
MNKVVVLLAAVLLAGVTTPSLGDELHMILVPRSTTLTAEGYVTFDVYLNNDGESRISAPAPEAEFAAFWTLRDVDNVRPEREGSNVVFGTDAVKEYVLQPKSAIRCEINNKFLAEPGDLLVLYITVDAKLKSGKTKTIRSNSVMLYRPK